MGVDKYSVLYYLRLTIPLKGALILESQCPMVSESGLYIEKSAFVTILGTLRTEVVRRVA